jgi:hypothetical protein
MVEPMVELTEVPAEGTGRLTVARAPATTAEPTVAPTAGLMAAQGTAQPTEVQGPTAAQTVAPTAGRADRH